MTTCGLSSGCWYEGWQAILALALYVFIILAATIAGDNARWLANELRRVGRLWHTEIKPVLSCILSLSKGTIEGWRLRRWR